MEALKILLVDDEPETTDLMKLALSRKAPGYSIATVNSGRECLDFLKDNKVDCILSDYQMPEMNGLELLQSIRKKGDDTPFIFLTGQGNEEVAREAFKEGANDYFTKDIGFAHFTRIVNSTNQAARQRRAHEAKLRAEMDVLQQKKEWEDTFNAINDPVTIQDTDFTIRRANKAVCNVLGTGFDGVIGRKCYEIFHGLDRPITDCPAKGLIEGFVADPERFLSKRGGLPTFEHEIPVKDKVFDVNVYPLNRDGGLSAFVHVAKDVTEHKRAEDSVVKSKEMLTTILQSVQFGMMIVGMDRKVRQVNQSALEMTGYGSEDEIIGRLCHETMCPAEAGRCPVLDLGMKVDVSEKILVDRHGNRLPILKSVSAIRLGDEDVLIETFVRKPGQMDTAA